MKNTLKNNAIENVCEHFQQGSRTQAEKVEQNHTKYLIRAKGTENKHGLDGCHMVQNMTDTEKMLIQCSKMD